MFFLLYTYSNILGQMILITKRKKVEDRWSSSGNHEPEDKTFAGLLLGGTAS